MTAGFSACNAPARDAGTDGTSAAGTTAASADSGDTVKVGILHSQSGTMAMAEAPMIQAAQMASTR